VSTPSGTGRIRRGTGRAGAALPMLLLLPGIIATGCSDPVSAGRDACLEGGIGELRCAAIVRDATARLDPGRPPLIGVDVRLATQADRTTLRDQLLVAVVRFSFLDGSASDIPVYCGPRSRRTAVCADLPG
jgi:hypothetical protein